MKKEKLKFGANWAEKGVGIVIAHPDDESMMWSLLERLVDVQIPVTVILLTLGEMGQVDGQKDLAAKEVGEIRRQEFIKAMEKMGVNYEILNFGDFGLATMPFRNLAMPLLNLLREKDFAAVFSFHPFEITPSFDHPDHNLAGEATRFAATAQDIRNLKVGSLADGQAERLATQTRPELYFWTTAETQATHQLKIDKKSRHRRQDYLRENYPSQFPRHSQKHWGTIFDRLGSKEYYQRVR